MSSSTSRRGVIARLDRQAAGYWTPRLSWLALHPIDQITDERRNILAPHGKAFLGRGTHMIRSGCRFGRVQVGGDARLSAAQPGSIPP
jgi:hypothetical protein